MYSQLFVTLGVNLITLILFQDIHTLMLGKAITGIQAFAS